MDNGTHTLLGAALAKTRLGRLHPLAALSLLIGANLPDADILVSVFGGKTAYLIHHRGITHSLLGVTIEALLLAWTMRAFERRGVTMAKRAGTATTDPLPLSAYLWPAFIGLFSHPLLDALNNFGVRPWLPFSDARYFGDLVFIVDPWLWLLFGGAALLSGARTRLGTATWIALAVGATVVLFSSDRTPLHMKWCWPFAVALLAALRALRVGTRRPERPLIVGALLFVVYLGGLEWCARTAVANALAQPSGPTTIPGVDDRAPPRFVMRSPTVADPFHWSLCFETDDVVRWRRFGLDGKAADFAEGYSIDIDKNLSDPDVERAIALPEASAWRYFVRVPTAWTERGADGGVHVFLSDARFQWGRGISWCVVEVDLPAGAAPTK